MYDGIIFWYPPFLEKSAVSSTVSLGSLYKTGYYSQLASCRKITNQNQREDLEVLVLALAMEEAGDLQTSNRAPLEWRKLHTKWLNNVYHTYT